MAAIVNSSRPRLADKARLKWDAVRSKHLLLFPEGFLVLSPTANEILELCDGRRTFDEIVKTLGERYQNNAIEADVKEVLQKLADKNFVKVEE
jgi:pyrroloquinoline quinone biosynthesis protein D